MISKKLLIQIHGYIAVFYLPLAILYAVTGGLYIIGERGGDTRETVNIQVLTPPQSATDAIGVMREELENRDWRVPQVADDVRELQGGYYWAGLAEVIRFTPSDSGEWQIYHQQNSWYKQLVEIHKDHAGSLFSILGFGFAIGMFILIVSGAIMMFQSPMYRRIATILVAVGTVVTIGAWIVTISG